MNGRSDYARRTAEKILQVFEANGTGPRSSVAEGVPTDVASANDTRRRRIVAISGPELLAKEIAPPRYLIDDLWLEESCGYFAGEPKCFKTYTIFDMALAVATGGQVFGKFQARRTGPVMMFLEETKPNEAQQRLRRLMNGRGVDAARIGHLHLVIQNRIRLDNPEDQLQILELCRTIGPVMTFFDPLARMRDGSESQPEDVGPVLNFLRDLQVECHTAVALTHHMSKPSTETGKKVRSGHRIRGSGDQYAWLDSALYFTRIADSERVQVEVEHRESADPAAFTIAVAGDAKDGSDVLRLEHHPGRLVGRAVEDATEAIRRALQAAPNGLKTREVFDTSGAGKDETAQAIRHMVEADEVVVRAESRPDKSHTSRRCKVHYLAELAPPAAEAGDAFR